MFSRLSQPKLVQAVFLITLGFSIGCAKPSDSEPPPPAAPASAGSENLNDYCGEVKTGAPAENPMTQLKSKTWVQKTQTKSFTSTVRLRFENETLKASVTCSSAYKFVNVIAVAPIELTDKYYKILGDSQYSLPFEGGYCNAGISKALLYYNVHGKCLAITASDGIASVTLVEDSSDPIKTKVNDQQSQ